MAFSFFKSSTEEPWDRFSRAMGRALDDAAGEFNRQYDRRIVLGSPVKISEPRADIIRVPVVVRGGTAEFAVACLHATEIGGKLDYERIRRIVDEAVAVAATHGTTPPRTPGQTVITYP